MWTCDKMLTLPSQIKSVIRRTKETPNVHPMFRDGHLRRKMGPIIVNKSTSQDRLIEELQGKFGIGRSERRRKQSDDWLTEGVIVTSKPQRFRPDGAGSEVDKVGFSVLSKFSQILLFPMNSPSVFCTLCSVSSLLSVSSVDHNSPRVTRPCEEGAPTSLSPRPSSPSCCRRT